MSTILELIQACLQSSDDDVDSLHTQALGIKSFLHHLILFVTILYGPFVGRWSLVVTDI